MKGKIQGIVLCFLIVATTSCGTFNNGNFFSSRQGKNKVIDRDFESEDQFEETDQIVETVDYEEPVISQELQPRSPEAETNTESTEPATENGINSEETFKETLNSTIENTSGESSLVEYEEVESNTIVSEEENTDSSDDGVRAVMIVILVIVILIVLLIVGFLVWLFSLFW
jgi:preprotein translocase subunit SecF